MIVWPLGWVECFAVIICIGFVIALMSFLDFRVLAPLVDGFDNSTEEGYRAVSEGPLAKRTARKLEPRGKRNVIVIASCYGKLCSAVAKNFGISGLQAVRAASR